MKHKGSCHCGQIAFEVEGDIPEVLSCNCSICQRKGSLLWFVPRQAFKLLTPPGKMSTYTFNKHVIKHHFCPKCGCAPFGFGESRGTQMAAVNVRCLEDVELASIKRQFVDGRSF